MYYEIAELIGQTMETVVNIGDEIIFTSISGDQYKFFHDQDCCESVYVEEVIGELQDLVGVPILMAEEVSNIDAPEPEGYFESYTWTFYKFATIKGYVTIRWLGTSNGYYSESVSFTKIPANE